MHFGEIGAATAQDASLRLRHAPPTHQVAGIVQRDPRGVLGRIDADPPGGQVFIEQFEHAAPAVDRTAASVGSLSGSAEAVAALAENDLLYAEPGPPRQRRTSSPAAASSPKESVVRDVVDFAGRSNFACSGEDPAAAESDSGKNLTSRIDQVQDAAAGLVDRNDGFLAAGLELQVFESHSAVDMNSSRGMAI